jgi:valine dehydrogenase (NAD+)
VAVADINDAAVDQVRARYPEVVAAASDELPALPIDVYAPCALGGAVDDQLVQDLQAQVICGAANNQLAQPDIDKLLEDRGILYAPDYVVNAGGLMQVAGEIYGYSEARARERASQIFTTTKLVFALADEQRIPLGQAADRYAEQRMAEIGRLRSLWLLDGK